MTTYIPWNTGLGDHIATIQLLLHRAEASREISDLSTLQHGEDFSSRMAEICSLIPLARSSLRLLKKPGDTPLDGFHVWATPFKPIADPWYWRGVHKYVTYQFDGVSSPQKNPSPEDQRILLDRLQRVYGFDCIPLGRGKTLSQCVELLAASHFFVGCDSGMSHLAQMVRVPIFLLEYDLPVVTCHRGKPYRLCSGVGDFLDHKLPNYLSYRKFLGLL